MEQTEIEMNEDKLSILDGMLSEEAAPESAATDDEPIETTASENDPELTGEGEEVATIDALNLADFDPEQLLAIGDETFSLADLREIYENRTASTVLEQQRAELAKLQKDLEAQKQSHSYLEHFDLPHQFLNEVLPRWIENGAMSQDAASRFVESFNGLISEGLYDMDKVSSVAEKRKAEAELARREQELEAKARQAEIQIELAHAASKYGELTDEIKQDALGVIESNYNRTGELMSLTKAFEVLEGQGRFKKAPPTRAKLADSLRRSGTVVPTKAGSELNKEGALKNLLKSK